MPRGVKGSGVSEGNSAKSADEQTKSVKTSTRILISSSISPDDVLALDSDGIDLMFEQTTKFLVLDDAIVAKLSPLNRTRYSMAREFHDTWRGEDHAEFVERFKVDKQMVGSATDKIDVKNPSGMKTRWTLPSKIAERRAQGYRILGADEANTYLGETAGHHEIGRLGQTELVLMGISEELYNKRQAEKTKKNNELAGAYKGSALSEMTQAGGQAFEATEGARDPGRWAELPPEEN